ncbi:MAG: 3-hydroxyacyl-CoA dehydrogenase family protein [Puia sp.]|nr:3-hydroxyacyl-CoA dehydrogenase family protein [Puia sp.]
MQERPSPDKIPVGVVGLGLMGCSIATCFLIAGHPVTAVAAIPADLLQAEDRITRHLQRAREEGIAGEDPGKYLVKLRITEDYTCLAQSAIVVECTIENIEIKRSVYRKIEDVIGPEALLTSNTSAIPISLLQQETRHPRRFFGLHWAEPSHTTRFLEVICGEQSEIAKGEWLCKLSQGWGKEPTLVRKDIRGFIANRLMYAMYREACFLVENGYGTVEDIDRACRNNTGYWMTLAGVFRWMDLTGVAAYHTVMKDLLPTLSNGTEIPRLIDDIVKAGGKGVSNARGFYEYTPEEARLWEETYTAFAYEIRELALRYPEDVVRKKLAAGKTNKPE